MGPAFVAGAGFSAKKGSFSYAEGPVSLPPQNAGRGGASEG